MAHVSVTINNRTYQIACDDGQEANLVRLAGYVDKRVGQLTAAVGQVGHERLLVMASLLVADELSDAFAELQKLRGTERRRDEGRGEADSAVNESLTQIAERIENIARQLEQA